MDSLDFTEEEILQELEILGYKNIPKHKLQGFKQDLDDLIQRGEWKSLFPSTQAKSQTATSGLSPPAYTKEKLSRSCFKNGDGFFLHAQNGDHNTRVLTNCQNRDYVRQGGYRDSYAQHSVASRLQLAPGAPKMLQVEVDPEDTTTDPSQTDSVMSSPDSHGRHFIRRKVLRTHNGESLVCDESIYSEDTGQQFTTMYKMYNAQWDKESDDDDDNSLNSSFWSDGERQDEDDEEERVEIHRMVDEEESKPAANAELSLRPALGEGTPEPNKQNITEENSMRTDEDDDDEGDSQNDSGEDDDGADADEDGDNDEERCSSSSSSPAPSLMTSGYGTYRPEEQEAGDYRDNHTITEFDQDSQGDLSEARDDGDDRSLCSFGGFDIEPTHDLDYESLRLLQDKLTDEGVRCEDSHEDVDFTAMKVEHVRREDSKEKHEDLTHTKEEEHQHHVTATEEKPLDGHDWGRGRKTSEKCETPEAEELGTGGSEQEDGLEEAQREEGSSVEKMESEEENNSRTEESESEQESSGNKDIKFIDSKVDVSWTTYRMLEEWEGNLRPNMDAVSLLEERLGDLRLTPPTQHDSDTENEGTSHDDTQSSDADRMSLTAFESYIRSMTRTRSEGDIRPKPKSFIRPVRSQPTIKKADPVAKYFQYKQLWEMFKLPGERDRKDLRSEIRERLAYQPPPPKPRRVFVPNTYTVPTEKKRLALRWEIRNDLAQGLLPHKYSYRF